MPLKPNTKVLSCTDELTHITKGKVHHTDSTGLLIDDENYGRRILSEEDKFFYDRFEYVTDEKPATTSDSAIIGTYRYLKSKAEVTIQPLDGHAQEMYTMTNADSLNFFKVMFKADLERLGLI